MGTEVHNQLLRAERCPLTHTHTVFGHGADGADLRQDPGLRPLPAQPLWLPPMTRGEGDHRCDTVQGFLESFTPLSSAVTSPLIMASATAWGYRELESQPQDPTWLWRQHSYPSLSLLPALPVQFPQALSLIFRTSEKSSHQITNMVHNKHQIFGNRARNSNS